MGRIKSTFVKTSAKKIYTKGKDEFTTDFDKNKSVVDKYATIPSKRLKNAVLGYITRLEKQSKTE
jgi:small subunit ribosomal protein S17e